MATPRQAKAVKLVSENIGRDKPEPIGKILRKAGYSNTVSLTPELVTKSKGFIELLEENGVTDDELTKVLRRGLKAKNRRYYKDKDGNERVDVTDDLQIQHKFLETAIKIKGHINTSQSNSGDTYNTYIQQNNLNPNTVDSKQLVDNTLEYLLDQTKAQE
jgi:hypothetical protein